MQIPQYTYWGIKIYFPSGNGYWLSDRETEVKLTKDPMKAKVFLTMGSASRYWEKMLALNPSFPKDKMHVQFEVLKEVQ